MQTTCPHCQTCFRIHAEQLSAKAGKVVCGICMQAFSALATLTEEPSIPYESIPPASSEPLIKSTKPAIESLAKAQPPLFPSEPSIINKIQSLHQKLLAERYRMVIVGLIFFLMGTAGYQILRISAQAPERLGLCRAHPHWLNRFGNAFCSALPCGTLAKPLPSFVLSDIRWESPAHQPRIKKLSFILTNQTDRELAFPSLKITWDKSQAITQIPTDAYSPKPAMLGAQARWQSTLWIALPPQSALINDSIALLETIR